MTYLIALTGRAGSGKSTVAAAIVKHPNAARAAVASFAKPLKRMLVELFYYTTKDHALASEMVFGAETKDKPLPELGGVTPRYLMQTLGTEWGRNALDPDFWVYIAASRLDRTMRNGLGTVFDDCRFENEANLVRRMGGVVIGVRGRESDAVTTDHESEHGVTPDFWVDNSGTPEDLAPQIDEIVEKYAKRPQRHKDLPDVHTLYAILYAQHPKGTIFSLVPRNVTRLTEAGLVEKVPELSLKSKRVAVRLTDKGFLLAERSKEGVDLNVWKTKPERYILTEDEILR